MIINEQIYGKIRLLQITGGATSTETLTVLADYALKNNLVKSNYKTALLEREETFPTGIQACYGIAIPHADQEFANEESIIIATLNEPSKFKAMGCGENVNVEVVFMLVLNKAESQVKVLSEIVNFIQDSKKMERLVNHDETIIQDIQRIFGKKYE